MPGCIFRVAGENFDVDGFIAESCWKDFAEIYHKGEQQSFRAEPHVRSGFQISVSDIGEHELEPQIQDTIDFLTEYSAEFQRLMNYPGIEYADFDIGLFFTKDMVMKTLSIPPALSKLAGELGCIIMLSIYRASVDET
ncbi:hypothetical protein JXA32_09370 [Candidatus Sumerlaeota bacterium]|nr:hypothetical protein [Candidatus Sumerlaeota bacterium]